MMIMMIDVLHPLLCTWEAKWAKRPPKVMKRGQRWNTLQICPRWDSNSVVVISGPMRYQLDQGGTCVCDVWYPECRANNFPNLLKLITNFFIDQSLTTHTQTLLSHGDHSHLCYIITIVSGHYRIHPMPNYFPMLFASVVKTGGASVGDSSRNVLTAK